MANYRTARIIPVALVLIIIALAIAALFSVARVIFFPNSITDTSEINLGQYVNRIKRIFTTVPVAGNDVLKCGNYNTEISVKNPTSDVMLLDFGNV